MKHVLRCGCGQYFTLFEGDSLYVQTMNGRCTVHQIQKPIGGAAR